MKKDNQTTQLLNWLNSEKVKDDIQVNIQKKKYIEEIKKTKKNELFVTQPKLSIWKKIKIMILGR